MSALENLLLHAARSKEDKEANLREATAYQHIIPKFLLIGRMSASLILLHPSMAAKTLPDLRTHHLGILAATVKCLQTQSSELHLISSSENDSQSFLSNVIMNGAMAAAWVVKGRAGHIIFRRLGNFAHRSHWPSRQLHRVSSCSNTSKIIAAANAMPYGLYKKSILNDVNIFCDLQLIVDWTALDLLSTSIKKRQECINKFALATISELFDERRLGVVGWCPG